MSVEADVVALLKAHCPRVLLDGSAEAGLAKPYVLWQLLGGESLRYVDNTAADKRMVRVQLAVWHTSLPSALTLMRAIEDAMCAATVFTARCLGEPVTLAEPGLQPPEYGATQDFEILGAR